MPVTIRDHANLSIDIGNVRICACDVDGNGNVENVDFYVDGELVICENIQTNDAYGYLIEALFRVHGKILSPDS